MQYKVGFLMDQIAGHITNYRNLRSEVVHDPELVPSWNEINYYLPGGKIENFHEKVVPFVPTYFTGITRAAIETRRALHNHKYDAIMSNISVGVFFSRDFRKTPTLIDTDSSPGQIDSMPGYSNNGKPDPKIVAKLKWYLSNKMYDSAVLVQAWSNWAKDGLIKEFGLPAEKIVVNPPGINLKFWQPNSHKTENKAGSPKRILFVGGDFRRKGGPLLLDWYKNQDPSKYELHIVTREEVPPGPGVFVYYDVQPNSQQLISLYQNSDLFVLPSLGECFGIANIEAMGSGLPVIASDAGGIADIIIPGRNGYIIPASDARALNQSISAILDNPDKANMMGRQSRLLAEERFDLHKNAQRTFAYLKQISNLQTAPQLALV